MPSRARLQRSDPGDAFERIAIVVLVCVFCTIAIPGTARMMRSARTAEATTRIQAIIVEASRYALSHPDMRGHPTWPPTDGGGQVDLSSTAHFRYSLVFGCGDDAFSTPLRCVAQGLPDTEFSQVRIQVTVSRIGVPYSKPEIEGM